jgi:metal-responsive CopG/Arc/MetJ family transcriptional regulator
MSKGGKREGSGRKKIGISIHTRVEEDLLERIDEEIGGNSRAEKIRNCLKLGLENNKLKIKSNERTKENGENTIR